MSMDGQWFIGLKLLSVFSIGCIGSAMLYLPTFYEKVLGLGTDKIGLLYSITPFVSCLSFPYWTSYLDRTYAYKRVMIQNMALALVSVLFIAAVPQLTTDPTWTLVLVALGNFGFSWFGYPMISAVTDTVIFLVLGDQKTLYGQQKVGCPIGFALAVFFTGSLMETMGAYALFVVFSACVVSLIVTVAVLHIPSPTSTLPSKTTCSSTQLQPAMDDADDQSHSSYGSVDIPNIEMSATKTTMWSLLEDVDAQRFFAVMVAMGMAIAVIQAFLFLFMQKDLGASPAMVGWLGPLGSSTEIICFFFSKQIFSALGAKKMLITGQVLTIFRCCMYMIALQLEPPQGAWLATVTQLLHGACFSLTWSAGALQADELAPPALKARAQGLLNLCFNGLGSGVGALLGGWIYQQQRLGANAMWLFVLLLMLLTLILYSRQRTSYARLAQA